MDAGANLTFVLADLLPPAIQPIHGCAATLVGCTVQCHDCLSRITKPLLTAGTFTLLPFGVEGAVSVEFAHRTVLSLVSCYLTKIVNLTIPLKIPSVQDILII